MGQNKSRISGGEKKEIEIAVETPHCSFVYSVSADEVIVNLENDAYLREKIRQHLSDFSLLIYSINMTPSDFSRGDESQVDFGKILVKDWKAMASQHKLAHPILKIKSKRETLSERRLHAELESWKELYVQVAFDWKQPREQEDEIKKASAIMSQEQQRLADELKAKKKDLEGALKNICELKKSNELLLQDTKNLAPFKLQELAKIFKEKMLAHVNKQMNFNLTNWGQLVNFCKSKKSFYMIDTTAEFYGLHRLEWKAIHDVCKTLNTKKHTLAPYDKAIQLVNKIQLSDYYGCYAVPLKKLVNICRDNQWSSRKRC
jgi:hypothetical protein